MSIQFREIPANNLVPIFATEFDNSLAAKPGPMPWKNLLIGQATKASAPTGITQISSDDQADSLFGAGSQIALMVKAFRKNAKYMELYCIALQDPASNSAAASNVLAFTGPASENGTLSLLIGGQAVNVAVAAEDTATVIASNVVAKVNALTNLPVTAAVGSSGNEHKVTLTAKNKGTAGNDISVCLNFNAGDTTPAGVAIDVFASASSVTLAGGSVDTEFNATNVGNLIEGTWFNAIAIGAGDNATTGNVAYIKDKLDERWTAVVQQTGVLYYGVGGNKTATMTAGNARNSQVICIPGLASTPSLPCEVAAAAMGAIAVTALNDPAVPLSNWPVKGIVAPKREDRLGFDSNNDILRAGVAMLAAGEDGTVYLKRTVTTYKTNAMGASDTSYQQLETVHTLSYLRWDWNNYLAGKYPHAKLADDGNEFGPRQIVMTPKKGKAEILTRYKTWMDKGLVQNFDEFKANVVVERDPDDSKALNFLIPADLIDQLFVCKSLMQFK